MTFCIRAAALDASGLQRKSGMSAEEWAALPCIVGTSSHGVGRVENDAQPEPALPIDIARELARSFGASGPVLATSSACTSGLMALQLALDLLEDGAFPHALVLGAELPNRLTAEGFCSLGLGMKLGAAVGALVVSREGPWRIGALAWATDPSSLTAVGAREMEAAMRAALSRAGWRPAEVDLVKLQAENDPAERQVLERIFSPLPKTASLRGEIGHTLGASGPVETALLLEGLGAERRLLLNFSGFGGQMVSMALERA